jgi:uncharacterized protein YukE
MTAPGGLNYPPDMVPTMEAFIQRATTMQGFGEDAKKVCDGLVNSSAGQVFLAMQTKFATLNAKFETDLRTAISLGNTSIQAYGDMMDTDRRATMMFE